MSEMNDFPRRVLVSYAAPDAYAPRCLELLERLGYAVVDPDAYESVADPDARPDAVLADERSLGEVRDDGCGPVPIVALVGRHGVTGADSRLVGAVPRPAGLHELYRVLQQVLEEQPRTTPRIDTHLVASCRDESGSCWSATVLSLSANGCLVRSPQPLLMGSKLELELDAPRIGPLELSAEVAYQLPPDVGLVFSSLEVGTRRALERGVAEMIAER